MINPRSWMRARGAFQFMLVGLLALVQLHFCAPIFRLPDGQACNACLTLTEESPSNSLTDANHGDCHDCCVLTACHAGENEQNDAAFPVAFLYFLLTEPTQEFSVASFETPASRPTIAASHPPTGPPPTPDGRAPPFASMV